MTRHSNAAAEDPIFRARLGDFGVERVEAGSLLASLSPNLLRGWHVALDRANRPMERLPATTRAWIQQRLGLLASASASDAQRACAGEVEAALRLSLLGSIERVEENPKARTVDFRIHDLNVEVYCPQEHAAERRVVEVELAQQLERAEGPVKVAVAIHHPTTGSGRSVDMAGQIQRDPRSKALKYPASKIIDRILSSKRSAEQFPDGGHNILWLDLKHGLGMRAIDCLPFRSEVAKGECYIGTYGVWHAFYGAEGARHFPERTTLEWPIGHVTYAQQLPGWFRGPRKVSAAILSLLDGIVLFENPWATTPLKGSHLEKLFRLSELRPEFSWSSCTGRLNDEVEIMLARISWLATLAETRSV